MGSLARESCRPQHLMDDRYRDRGVDDSKRVEFAMRNILVLSIRIGQMHSRRHQRFSSNRGTDRCQSRWFQKIKMIYTLCTHKTMGKQKQRDSNIGETV
jgi:hypothetical protein